MGLQTAKAINSLRVFKYEESFNGIKNGFGHYCFKDGRDG